MSLRKEELRLKTYFRKLANKNLLVIVGPTASGKTELAGRLARKFSGELVSADSRQVYRHMDIGTGKDRPTGVKIWGYDLAEPWEEFSVAQYAKFAEGKIVEIWRRGKLPILVGGTGLYVRAVTDGIRTIGVPRNEELRKKLKDRSASELLARLIEIDKKRASRMNDSDRKNPRRLIRAIEIAADGSRSKALDGVHGLKMDGLLIVGIKIAKSELDRKIEDRVEARIRQGFEEEVDKLLAMGVSWDMQSMQALGYKQERGRDVEGWKRSEKQYAKRQMTWFEKDKRIVWLKPGEVEGVVEKWYSSNRDAEEN